MKNLNPAVCLICAFFYSMLVSFSDLKIYFLAPILYLLFIKKDEIFSIFKKLFFLNFFIIFLFAVVLLQDNFSLAINIYLRVNFILLFNLLLFSNSKGYDIVKALMILKFPDKFNSSVYFTFKMINSLSDDFKEIKDVLKLRGFKPKTDMFTYKTYGNILGMLFINAMQKSQDLKQTFLLRGFRGRVYLLCENKISNYDYILLFFVFLIYLLKVVL